MKKRLGAVVATICLVLAACNYAGPPLAGYDGLQFQLTSFYERYAQEQNATCNSPVMQGIFSTTVLSDTREKLVLDVRYSYFDRLHSDGAFDGGFARLGNQRCNGIGNRQFTMSKMTDGTVSVIAMTGMQRTPRS